MNFGIGRCTVIALFVVLISATPLFLGRTCDHKYAIPREYTAYADSYRIETDGSAIGDQQSPTLNCSFSCQVTISRGDASVPEKIAFLAYLEIEGMDGSMAPVSINLPLSVDKPSIARANVSMSANPSIVFLRYITLDTPLLLDMAMIVGQNYEELVTWRVDQTGDSFVYYPLTIFGPGRPFSALKKVPFSAQEQGWVPLGGYIYPLRQTVEVTLSLTAGSAKKYTCDASILRDLGHMLIFEDPSVSHVSRDLSFILASKNAGSIHVAGSYLQSVPSLPDQKWIALPFEFDMLPDDKRPLPLGYKVLSSLAGSSYAFVMEEWDFLNRSRAVLQDLTARYGQARADILLFNSSLANEPSSATFYALERGLKLLAESHDALSTISESSSLIVPPILTSFILIFSVIVSNLFFNGSKKATFITFGIIAILAIVIHPGLTIFAMSLKPESSLVPVTMIFVSFLITYFLIFKTSFASSKVGLAISTAVRSTKARKLRGILAVSAVVIVAMAAVPSLTIKTIQQTRTEVLPIDYSGSAVVSLSHLWILRKTMRTPTVTTVTDESGWFPMNPSEASSYAKNMGLKEFTSVSLAFYDSSKAQGYVIFANLTFLRRYAGLTLEETASLTDNNSVFINGKLDSFRLGDTLAVADGSLKVAGFFSSSCLRYLNGEPLEEYLNGSQILFGNPDWDTVLFYPTDPFDKSTAGKIPPESALFAPPQRVKIAAPIVGLADVSSTQSKNPAKLITILTMGVLAKDTNLEESGIKDLIFLTKESLSYYDYTTLTTTDFISSISVSIAHNGTLRILRTDFPATLLLGSWTSQLVIMGIGTLIVYAVILGSVFERIRESTTISSLGASPDFITYSFLAEGLMLGVIGGVIGFSLGYVVATQIGTSSPDVASELITLTPMILVLSISIATTGLASILPARGAILKVVPSRTILTRGIGEVRVDNTGARLIHIPLKLMDGQVESFYRFLSRMVSPIQYYRYGIQVFDYKEEASEHRLLIAYRGTGVASDRLSLYQVNVELVPLADYLEVELAIRSPEGPWTKSHDYLFRDMAYALRGEILKYSVPHH